MTKKNITNTVSLLIIKQRHQGKRQNLQDIILSLKSNFSHKRLNMENNFDEN